MASSSSYNFLFSLKCLSLLLLSIFILLLHLPPAAYAQDHPFAQGNLFVVFQPRSGRSSEQSPQLVNLSALWCQATLNGQDRLLIKDARFVRTLPKPEKAHPSRLNAVGDRAFLDFGLVPISSVGKYRCEITTRDDDFVTGNLFVYMRPVLSVNNSGRFDQAEDGNNFAWVGPTTNARAGDDAVLNCPTVGYPLPQIRWFKNGAAINTSATVQQQSEDGGNDEGRRKYFLVGQSLYIHQVEDDDGGTYKCMATNSFPLRVDSENREFQLSLEQDLRVTTSLSWLIPLLLIIFGLLFLAIIIFSCAQWKRYKHEQYNVARKEREFGTKGPMDGEKLQLEPDDVAED